MRIFNLRIINTSNKILLKLLSIPGKELESRNLSVFNAAKRQADASNESPQTQFTLDGRFLNNPIISSSMPSTAPSTPLPVGYFKEPL